MRHPHPDLPVIDPGDLIHTSDGVEEMRRLIEATGYRAPEQLLSDFVLSLKLGRAWLIAGHRGGGKTAFPLALIRAFNLPYFWLQCVDGLELEDVLYRWDETAQNQWVLQSVAAGMPLDEARAAQWNREYLQLGEVLAAFEYAARPGAHRPVLVIDEEDKLEPRIEDMLLQACELGYAEVPRYRDGLIGFPFGADRSRWPIVIVTSNELRHDASSPFRSRCIYTPMELPTAREQVLIIRSRFPEAPRECVLAVARMLEEMRAMTGFRDKPGIREALDLTRALLIDGVTRIDEATLRRYLGLIAKRRHDMEVVRQGVGRLAAAANTPHPEVDRWVDDMPERENAFMRSPSLIDPPAGGAR